MAQTPKRLRKTHYNYIVYGESKLNNGYRWKRLKYAKTMHKLVSKLRKDGELVVVYFDREDVYRYAK